MNPENCISQRHYKEAHNIFLELLQDECAVQHLMQLKQHYPATLYHGYNVGVMCLDLALVYKLSNQEVRDVTVAGFLHDIGKDIVPVTILTKPSKLNSYEEEKIQEHSRRGFEVLQELGEDTVKKIVVGHHENQPGPYPRKSKPYDSPLEDKEERRDYNPNIIRLTEFLSIADIYEAIVSKRPYKPAIIESFSLENELRGQFTGSKDLLEQVIQRYVLK